MACQVYILVPLMGIFVIRGELKGKAIGGACWLPLTLKRHVLIVMYFMFAQCVRVILLVSGILSKGAALCVAATLVFTWEEVSLGGSCVTLDWNQSNLILESFYPSH